MDCSICCEKYNKSLNAKITCYFTSCNFEACKTCIRTYLLNTTNDPHCMSCKNPWDTKFIVDNLNRSFVDNDYKKHRKQLLVEREISRTPELMNLVEQTKHIEEKEDELKDLTEEYNKIRMRFTELGSQIGEKKFEIRRIKEGEDGGTERKKFIMPCPGDNCKGYLSTQYKCEVCKLYTCPDCFEIIGYSKQDEHVCKEESLKSTELIKKETKGCPQCGVRIFKISGCDQMWCTECKVAFSWNTGKIILSQNIHNPHYYNYMRNNGLLQNGDAPRNPGDVLCGGLIGYHSINSISRLLDRFKNSSYEYFKILLTNNNALEFLTKYSDSPLLVNLDNKLFNVIGSCISEMHRIINHITNYDLINIRNKVRYLENHDTITVQYILNKKTKDELATNIFKNDNLRKKYTELLNVYELISVFGIERFNTLYDDYLENSSFIQKGHNNKFVGLLNIIFNIIDEFNNLIEYTNKQLKIISYTYNQSVALIHFDLKSFGYFQQNEKFKQSDIIDLDDNKQIKSKSKKKLPVAVATSESAGSSSGAGSSSLLSSCSYQ